MLIGVLDGPNLDRLGRRERRHYGAATLEEVRGLLRRRAEERGVELETFQSNGEGELVEWLHERGGDLDGCLVNAGGLTHTSVVLRDALAAVDVPFVEVHLSNVHAREPFRRESRLADLAVGVVTGFREHSYLLALDGLLAHLENRADEGEA